MQTPAHNQIHGVWLIIGAAVLWGTTGTAQAFAPEGVSSASIGAARLLIGSVALVLFALAQQAFRSGNGWLWRWLIVGGIAVAAYQLTFFYGVALTGVAVGTIVGIGSAPVFGGLVGVLFTGEKLSRRWMLASLLAIFGAALLTIAGNASRSTINPVGVLLALGAGASYALYAAASKRLVEQQKPSAVMAAMFSIGAVLLLPFLLSNDLSWLATGRGIAVAAHLGIMTVGLSYVLFAYGLLIVSVSTATTLSLAEPMTAALLGLLLLREPLSLQSAIGTLLIGAGLAILAFPQARPKGQQQRTPR